MVLISGKKCPKCKILESLLNKKGIQYKTIFAEDNMDFCKRWDISTLPTLMIEKLDGKSLTKGLSECIKYININQ